MKVPSPLLRRTVTEVQQSVTARSGLPFPKSPTTTAMGPFSWGEEFAGFEKLAVVSGVAIEKKSAFERPPPGVGLTTVIEAVLAAAMSADGTCAVSCLLLTNAVVSRAPLKSTVAPEMKPVPFTVSVKPAPPGEVASGTNGWLTNGTGFPGGIFEFIVIPRSA